MVEYRGWMDAPEGSLPPSTGISACSGLLEDISCVFCFLCSLAAYVQHIDSFFSPSSSPQASLLCPTCCTCWLGSELAGHIKASVVIAHTCKFLGEKGQCTCLPSRNIHRLIVRTPSVRCITVFPELLSEHCFRKNCSTFGLF